MCHLMAVVRICNDFGWIERRSGSISYTAHKKIWVYFLFGVIVNSNRHCSAKKIPGMASGCSGNNYEKENVYENNHGRDLFDFLYDYLFSTFSGFAAGGKTKSNETGSNCSKNCNQFGL